MMPRIVACGSRNEAYSDYETAIQNGNDAVLLVDSEASVLLPKDHNPENIETWDPWYHLKYRSGRTGEVADGWDKPPRASNEDCHLMVESMESWFLADVRALKRYYGSGFDEEKLPKRSDIENIGKENVLRLLKLAARKTPKKTYDKGEHSFEILSEIDPHEVADKSPWAKRFFVLLGKKMRNSR